MIGQHQAEVLNKVKNVPTGDPINHDHLNIKFRTWPKDSDPDQSISHEITTGQNQLEQSFESIIKQMNVGDIWEIKTWNMLQESHQTLNVQIRNKQQSKQVNQIPDRALLAEEKKKIGNAHIKQKNYKQAIEAYQFANELLEFDCRKSSVELRLSIISNLALATLNSGLFDKCKQWCDKHIKESVDKNKKIIYRQASAEKGLKNWEQAKIICLQAIRKWEEEAQTVSDFKGLKQSIEKAEKEEIEKSKKVYSKMFG